MESENKLSNFKLEFLKSTFELFESAIKLSVEGNLPLTASNCELELRKSADAWVEIKSLYDDEKSGAGKYYTCTWISPVASNSIVESNLSFLVKSTKNWSQLKNLLLQGQYPLMELMNFPHDAVTMYRYILICQMSQTYPNDDEFFDIFLHALKASDNHLLCDLLRMARGGFKASAVFAEEEANWRDNEEDLSKLGTDVMEYNQTCTCGKMLQPHECQEGLHEKMMPNFLNYVDLPMLAELNCWKEKLKRSSILRDKKGPEATIPSYHEINEDHDLTQVCIPDNNENIAHDERSIEILKQCGTPNRFEIFSPILTHGNNSHPAALTCLHLECLDIYTPFLFQTLGNCPNLKNLRMLEVRFIGELNRRVKLPKLTTFALTTRLANLDKGEGRSIDRSMLKSIIFFDLGSPWNVENISALQVDIDICINGERIFKIRHQDGLLYSQLKFTNAMLQNIANSSTPASFRLLQLFIRFCTVDISLFPEYLKLLEVKDIVFSQGADLSTVFERCPQIKVLRVGHVTSEVFKLIQLASAVNLKSLYLYNVHIPYLPVVVKLDTLFLYCCSLSLECIDKFSRIFKCRRILIICKTMEHCNFCSFCSHIRILNEARQSECARWISFKKFDRGHRNNHTDNRNYLIENGVESFLTKAGVSKGSTHFIIEKNDANIWIGKDVTVDDVGWIEQQSVIQTFEVVEDDMTVVG